MARHVPVGGDGLLYKETLRDVTPSRALWRSYSAAVARWLRSRREDTSEPFSLGQALLVVSRVELEESEVFGWPYPVGRVEERAFRAAFGTFDAAAVSCGRWAERPPIPPLILIPQGTGRRRRTVPQSVLEHEFVHINQMLLESQPLVPVRRTASAALGLLVAVAHAEYQANIVQFANWPMRLPGVRELSLERWCAFRAYTQALEPLMRHVMMCRLGPRTVRGIAATLQHHMARVLGEAHIQAGVAPWLERSVPAHLALATRRVGEENPAIRKSPTYRRVLNIVRRKLPRPTVYQFRQPRPEELPF